MTASNFYIDRAKTWLAQGQTDRIAQNIASILLGRDFGEHIGVFLARNPDKKQYLDWWEKIRAEQIKPFTHTQLSVLSSALQSWCCTEAERNYRRQIISEPHKAFRFEGETLLRSRAASGPDGYSFQDLEKIYPQIP